MLRSSSIFLSFLMLAAVSYADTTPLRGLLNDVKHINQADTAVNRQREAEFKADLNDQTRLLNQSRQRLQNSEQEQARLKALFDQNDLKLAELEAQLQQRSGQLGEIFGVAKEISLELKPLLDDSIVSAQYSERIDALAFAKSNRIPELADLQSLWYQLQLEMTASGEVAAFDATVVDHKGRVEDTTAIRVGTFITATQDGRYLNWDVDQQTLISLPTQPSSKAQNAFIRYAEGETTDVLVDPSRGQLLQLLDRLPKLSERLQQGGEVGYVIMALGVIGLLVALYQMLKMTMTELKIKRQLSKPDTPSSSNPLGRVLAKIQHTKLDLSQLELKADELILRELPAIERGQSALKLLAAVAPLLGLLGTVVGMIATFQSITLFGTSDPKLMAGGISQALMTTVLGLVVAIPLLFCHSYLSAKSRRITQLLQEKSLGVLFDASTQEETRVPTNQDANPAMTRVAGNDAA